MKSLTMSGRVGGCQGHQHHPCDQNEASLTWVICGPKRLASSLPKKGLGLSVEDEEEGGQGVPLPDGEEDSDERGEAVKEEGC
jgi:hypothetical protein